MKSYSLTKHKNFSRVYKKGSHFSSKNFVLYVLRNNYRYTRLGISASKKIGCAVRRNRVCRVVKKAFINLEFQLRLDIIFVAKPNSVFLKLSDAIYEINKILYYISFDF